MAVDLGSKSRHQGVGVADAVTILNGHRDVVATVSRRAAFVRAIRVPNASREQVAQVLGLQVGNLFPIAASELSYDFRLTDDVNAEGRLAILGAMRATDLTRLHDEAKASGLKIQQVVPAAFGSMLLAKQMGMTDCAVVQRTPEGLGIDIISGGELRYSRLSPADGSASIEAEIQRTFAAAGVEPGPVIAADGLDIPGASTVRSSTLEAFGLPIASGLSLNLEQASVIAARVRREEQTRIRRAVLICAAALLMATYVFVNRASAQKAADDVNALDNRHLKDETAKRDKEQALQNASVKLQQSLNRGFKPAQKFSDIIATVTNNVPQGMWLKGMTIERGKPMTITGTALTSTAVADYLRILTDEPRLRDAKVNVTNNTMLEEKPVVEFSMSAFPVGNLPLSETKKLGAKK